MTFEDLLFKDFIENGDEHAFEKLIELVDTWLFAVIYTFICDENETDEMIRQVWKQVIYNKYDIYKKRSHIIFEIFKITKRLLFEVVR